jgi:dihydrofolate reductase
MDDASDYDFTSTSEVAMTRKRKIIVSVATSADGFIGRTDGSLDWLDRPRPKGNYGIGAFYQSIDTILWGRKTCDMALPKRHSTLA